MENTEKLKILFIYACPLRYKKIKYQINTGEGFIGNWQKVKEPEFYDFILKECPEVIKDVQKTVMIGTKFIIDIKNNFFKTMEANYEEIHKEQTILKHKERYGMEGIAKKCTEHKRGNENTLENIQKKWSTHDSYNPFE